MNKDEIETLLPTVDKPARPKVHKMDYLDSIRGIAAAAVLIHHAVWGFHPQLKEYLKPTLAHPFMQYAFDGTMQVNIFFVLSGRVLVHSYMKSPSNAKLLSAMVRRPFRLAIPVILAMTIASYFYYTYIPNSGYMEYTSIIQIPNSWKFVEYPVRPEVKPLWRRLVIDMFGNGFSLFHQAGVLWTIPLECFFSYYTFILAFVIAQLKRGQILVIFLACAYAFVNGKQFGLFFYGLAISYLDIQGLWAFLRNPKSMIFKVLFGIMKLYLLRFLYLTLTKDATTDLWYRQWDKYMYPMVQVQTWFRFALAPVMVIVLAEISSVIQFILNLKPFVFMGRISFGLYLAHGPMLPLMKVCAAFFVKHQFGPLTVFWASFAIFFVASVLAGTMFYYFVDKQSVKFVNYMYHLLFIDENPIENIRNLVVSLFELPVSVQSRLEKWGKLVPFLRRFKVLMMQTWTFLVSVIVKMLVLVHFYAKRLYNACMQITFRWYDYTIIDDTSLKKSWLKFIFPFLYFLFVVGGYAFLFNDHLTPK
jgi:peptidoglycan/LPS O-acetylase OafA/YrhL